MLAAMIIPTGVGASIGGHSGDATSAACLLASAVDTLIVHPNIVNASDLYAMPPNALYVEGSMLDAMLGSNIWLRPRRLNRVLVLCNERSDLTENAVSAARGIYGVAAHVETLDHPLVMHGGRDATTAVGRVEGVDQLITQLRIRPQDFDAVAVHSPVEVDPEIAEEYFRGGGINPWGLVEAMLSRKVSRAMYMPCAHAPLELHPPAITGPTYSRVAPEMICGTHLVSVLAGLSGAPGWVPRRDRPHVPAGMQHFKTRATDIGVEDVDVLITPLCHGTPHKLCRHADVPIMWIMENTTAQGEWIEHNMRVDDIRASNYLEAAGRLLAMRVGRSAASMGTDV